MSDEVFEIRGAPMSKKVLFDVWTQEKAVTLSISRDNKSEDVCVIMGSTFRECGQDDHFGDIVGFSGYIKNEQQAVYVNYNCRTGLGWLNFK
jgi:hypothetical protein